MSQSPELAQVVIDPESLTATPAASLAAPTKHQETTIAPTSWRGRCCGICFGACVAMGAILSIAFIMFLIWGPYLMWLYNKNPIVVAIFISALFVFSNVITVINKKDDWNFLDILSFAALVGLYIPAIVYAWLYFGTSDAFYDRTTGEILLAHGIVQSVLSFLQYIILRSTRSEL